MLRTKLSPKRSFGGQGVVTGEALATLIEEYVKAANSPGGSTCCSECMGRVYNYKMY
ncbi:hypothetical protein OS493_004471 [Desmophyllum pertusum]|uniref:Uncharacterized protein n=1 Tax=Desmophyllum pertusum TaxID=174260 RepID=A0A9W9ZHW7_9CNID|nr:hypothetical protein OS493_004471 [Desmophyllum pertusum]